ncbi:MAG: hypothetical protein EA370_13530 [Wenzhouxiangella sp.]|nr:MAG: hypothetical protein EA370_13530 [Wenzhouxiangella sp.]
MKNALPNIRGYLAAADTIVGTLSGAVILVIIVFVLTCVAGFGFYAFFFMTSLVGIGPGTAGTLFIVLLGLVAVGLVITMVLMGNER